MLLHKFKKYLERLNFSWYTYSDHLKQMMQTLIHDESFTGMTLVCDDKTKFKAHKFILCACNDIKIDQNNSIEELDFELSNTDKVSENEAINEGNEIVKKSPYVGYKYFRNEAGLFPMF